MFNLKKMFLMIFYCNLPEQQNNYIVFSAQIGIKRGIKSCRFDKMLLSYFKFDVSNL